MDRRRLARVPMLRVAAGAMAASSQAATALALALGNPAQLGALVRGVLLPSGMLGAYRDAQSMSDSLLAGRPLARCLGVAFAIGVLTVPRNPAQSR